MLQVADGAVAATERNGNLDAAQARQSQLHYAALLRREVRQEGAKGPARLSVDGHLLGSRTGIDRRGGSGQWHVPASKAHLVDDHVVGDGEQPAPERAAAVAGKATEGLGEDLRRGVLRRFLRPKTAVAEPVDGRDMVVVEVREGARIGARRADEGAFIGG